MVFLQTQFVIALLFGAAVIEVDDAVAAPSVGVGQDVSEQAFGVAVAKRSSSSVCPVSCGEILA